jgi:hypothetical protein
MSYEFRECDGTYPSMKRAPTVAQRKPDFDALVNFTQEVIKVAEVWEDDCLVSGGPGFAVNDYREAYAKALSGPGVEVTISPLADYKDEDPDCLFNFRFDCRIRAPMWTASIILTINAEIDHGYTEDGERPYDQIVGLLTEVGYDAVETAGRKAMRAWFTKRTPLVGALCNAPAMKVAA